MKNFEITKLRINYKTLEEFKQFREYGNQELSMLEDLRTNMIENDSDSPFYGIYFGDRLIARMSLYAVPEKYDRFFKPTQDYLELWKLEILPEFQRKGYGEALVTYAKEFNMPIKTNPRINSHEFWKKMGFSTATYHMDRDLGANPLIWMPKGVSEYK